MKKLLILVFAMFVACAAFAERPPMYAGGLMGMDSYEVDDRCVAFSVDGVFGIRPLPPKNMGFEAILRYSFPYNHKNGTYKYNTTYSAFSTRYFYDFKPFSFLPKMNGYVYGGFGFVVAEYDDWTGTYVNTQFALPVGAGLRYKFLDHLEGVLRAEFGMCDYWEFNLSTGVHYTF